MAGSPKDKEAYAVKKLPTIAILSAAATFALATASFSGPVPNLTKGDSTQAVDPQTIAELQTAAKQALADGRNGNKNHAEFARKNYEINLLIDKLQSGQQVDPSEIDNALEPVHVW